MVFSVINMSIPPHLQIFLPTKFKYTPNLIQQIYFVPLSKYIVLVHRLIYYLHILLHHSMQHSPPSETNRRPATKEISYILYSPKVHYCVHQSPPLYQILSQMEVFLALPSYTFKINVTKFYTRAQATNTNKLHL